ncbi:MAG: hypothetical protein FJ303_14805 [Planctomycetes bacterium]|nr:hypothetical protein [Planctomycetota bacterium]
MANPRQAGQTGSAKRWIALALCGLLGLMNGCSSTQHAAAPGPDPILGVLEPPGMPKPTSVPKTAAGPRAPQSYQQAGVPGLPTSLTSTNTATLATMSSQGLLGQPLRIDDSNSSGPSFFNRPAGAPGVPGYIPPNPNPKVEPVPDSKPIIALAEPVTTWRTPPTAAADERTPVLPASAALPASAELLSKQLQDLGVVEQEQVLVPEGIRLTCYVQRGPNAGLRILEATAVDYASAADAILKQLTTAR